MNAPPDLSVVVPVLDEASAAPRLVAGLARQEGLRVEVVSADGGSRDGTPELLVACAREAGLALRIVDAPRGRASQMNAGARSAASLDLLFLHADSEFPDPGFLGRAREVLLSARSELGRDRVAGHFALDFRAPDGGTRLGQYVLEARSRLTLPEFVTGDQGIWLSRRYFEELGGFDGSLPIFEDVRLARRVSETGAWVRLPGALTTSARRFESEGLAQRLLLNALLRGCEAAGLTDLLGTGRGYRPHGRGGAADVRCACRSVLEELGRRGLLEGLRALARAGAFGSSQAWQLRFLLHCARARRRGIGAEVAAQAWLQRRGGAKERPSRLLGVARRPAAAFLGVALFCAVWGLSWVLPPAAAAASGGRSLTGRGG